MSAEYDAMVDAATDAMHNHAVALTNRLTAIECEYLAREALSAALRVTLPEPCPTCGDTRMVKTREMACGDCPLPSSEPCCDRAACPDHHPSRWAVLPVLQELGVVEPGAFDHDSGEWVAHPFFPDDVPAFRPAPTPENPEVSP